jgi:Flp pilus assembly protein TadD
MKKMRWMLVVLVLIGTMVPAAWAKFPGKGSYDAWLKAIPLYDQGTELVARGKFDLAVQKFQSAIALYPFDGRFYCNMAAAYDHRDKYKLAESSVRRAILVEPSDPDYRYNLAKILAEESQYVEASAVLKNMQKMRLTKAQAAKANWLAAQIEPYLRNGKGKFNKSASSAK